MALENGSSGSTLLLIVLMTLVTGLARKVVVEAHVNAIYVFGDSTMDVGNNNYLQETRGKANFFYYGIDFPNSIPTGRFSNGFNTADELAKLLGFPMSPPPFLSLTQSNITKQMLMGINFASGGSGLLDNTGSLLVGEAIHMGQQIKYFATVTSNLTMQMSSEGAANFLSNSFFLISTGSNDLFENIVTPNNTFFVSNLTFTYKNHLRVSLKPDLYDLGARKFGIISIPPVGCTPALRIDNKTCSEGLNNLSSSFYQDTRVMLEELQTELPQMKYSLGDTNQMVANMYQNPMPLQLKELQYACCGAGDFNGRVQCNVTVSLCVNRKEYLFWDLVHPTQAASKLAAETLFSAGTEFVAPINFRQLAEE